MRDRYGLGKDDLVLFFMGWVYDFAGLQEAVCEIARLETCAQTLSCW